MIEFEVHTPSDRRDLCRRLVLQAADPFGQLLLGRLAKLIAGRVELCEGDVREAVDGVIEVLADAFDEPASAGSEAPAEAWGDDYPRW